MHRTFEELERLWQRQLKSPYSGRVDGLVRRLPASAAGGRRSIAQPAHETPQAIEVSVEEGVVGDRWRGSMGADSQISLTSTRVARLVAGSDERLHLVGDNLIVDFDTGEGAVSVGDRLQVGGVVLEITDKPHTGCNRFRARFGSEALSWVNAPEFAERRLRGLYGRVVAGGRIALGDSIRRCHEC